MTYTGNGRSGRGIAHNLGSVPGMIIIKRSDGTSNWIVYHSGLDSVSPEDYYFYLDATNARIPDVTMWDSTAPTDTVFTVGNDNAVNGGGSKTYVAYLFAHNDGDGEFGPDADQDIISCGSYTGDGGAGTTEINLGWQPQFVIIKASSAADNWWMFDTMRGIVTDPNGANDATLYPNEAYAEADNGAIDLTATGFKTTLFSNVNVNGRTYVYMAIRAPMITEPEAATEVFAIDTFGGSSGGSAPAWRSGFPVDMAYYKDTDSGSGHNWNMARLTGTNYLLFDSTAVAANSNYIKWDYQNGYWNSTSSDSTTYSWMWKRAKGYFDVTTWAVDGTNNQTINHNLGVIPEMVWSKNTNDSSNNSGDWWVGHDGMTGWDGANENDRHAIKLNKNFASSQQGYHRDFTTTSINLRGSATAGTVGNKLIAYLFATLDGISKVGSYTGTGSHDTHVIDCGFSNGARFVLLKRTDAQSDWFLWDSARGITNSADPRLSLNTTAAEYNGLDDIRPHASGFIAANPNGSDVNANGSEWIFYAVA